MEHYTKIKAFNDKFYVMIRLKYQFIAVNEWEYSINYILQGMQRSFGSHLKKMILPFS